MKKYSFAHIHKQIHINVSTNKHVHRYMGSCATYTHVYTHMHTSVHTPHLQVHGHTQRIITENMERKCHNINSDYLCRGDLLFCFSNNFFSNFSAIEYIFLIKKKVVIKFNIVVKSKHVIIYNKLRRFKWKKLKKIEVKIVECEVTECKGLEFLAQCLVYDRYFQRLYQSMRGRKRGK